MSKTNRSMSRRHAHFAMASLTAALAMGVSHQAMAAECKNNPPATGQTVDCTGTGNGAVIAPVSSTTGLGTVTGVTVDVETNATITGVGLSALGYGGTPPALNGSDQYSSISVNDSSKVIIEKNASVLPTLASTPRDYVGVNLNGSNTTLINNGSITLDNTAGSPPSIRLYGVITSVPGLAANAPTDVEFENVKVTNNGSISVSQAADAVARGIYAGEGIDSMTIDNFGTIKVKRTDNTTSTQATAGIDADDDVDTLVVKNHKGASITSEGGNTYAVSGRAQDYTLLNDGTITTTGGKGAIGIYGGGDDGPSETTIDNSKKGTITGDVYIQDQSPLGTKVATSNNGTRNSDMTNEGTITGSFFYGAGAHTLDNSNKITGGLNVNQQTGATGYGAAAFNFTNEAGATLGGSISIKDRASSQNSVTLEGTGFNPAGTISSTGFGALSLTLDGVKKIGGASGVTALDLVQSNVNVAGAVVVTSNTNNPVSQIGTTIFDRGGSSLGTATTNLGSIQGTLTLNGAKTEISPTFGTIVHGGNFYELASTVNGTGVGQVSADSSYLVSVNSIVNGGHLFLKIGDVANALDTPGISKPAGQTINGLLGYTGSDGNVLALGGAVQNLQTAGDVAKAGAQLAPETNFATQQAAITLNNAIGQHIDTRLNSVGGTGAYQGYKPAPYGLGMTQSQADPNKSYLGGSLKDDDGTFVAPRSAALWAQGFGAGMNQDEREQVDGYDARIYGIMAGYDNWITPGVRVGVAGGYANTSIDGNGDTTQNHTDIDSYLVEAYGAVKGSGWYATGRTGFTWHNYDTTRVLTVPIADSAKGSHDGDQFNVAFEAGLPMHFAQAVITPVASLTYSRLHQDAYSESSDGGMGLSVASQDNDSLLSGLGVKGILPLAADTVVEGRALWLHEFEDDSQIVTASFAAGGGAFTAAGPSVGRDSADLGVGLLAQIGNNSTFEINYDANVRDDYLAHVGSARVDINF